MVDDVCTRRREIKRERVRERERERESVCARGGRRECEINGSEVCVRERQRVGGDRNAEREKSVLCLECASRRMWTCVHAYFSPDPYVYCLCLLYAVP